LSVFAGQKSGKWSPLGLLQYRYPQSSVSSPSFYCQTFKGVRENMKKA